MCRLPFFLLLLLVVTASAFVASSSEAAKVDNNKPHRRRNWKKLPNRPVLDSDTIDFKLYLKLNQEHRSNVLKSESSFVSVDELRRRVSARDGGTQKTFDGDNRDEVSQRLALWRILLAPSQSDVSSAQSLIDSLGLTVFCGTAQWDHFSCKEVPHGLAKDRIFFADGVEFAHFQDELSGATRLFATKHPAKTELLFRDQGAVDFISNIRVVPRHLQRQSRWRARHSQPPPVHNAFTRDAFGASDEHHSDNSDGDNNNNYNPSYIPLQPPVTTEFSLSPILVDARFHDAVSSSTYNPHDEDWGKVARLAVTPFCMDQSLPVINLQDGTFACVNLTQGETPTSINWEIRELVAASAASGSDNNFDQLSSTTANSGNFAIDAPGACVSAGLRPNYRFAANQSTIPLCAKSIARSAQNSLPVSNNPFVVRIQTVFGSGATSEWSVPVNFLNSSYFDPAGTTRFPLFGSNNDDDVFYQQHKMYGDASAVIEGRSLASFLPMRGMFANEIRAHYNVPNSIPNVSTVNPCLSQGVIEFPDSSDFSGYNASDVDTYMKIGGISGYSSDLLTYIGADSNLAPSGEATMDVELLMGVAPGIKTVFWNYDDRSDADFATTMSTVLHSMVTESGDVATSLLSARNFSRPTTWSMSWSACEDASYKSAVDAMNRAGTYAAALSASGVTFVASSGDAGTSCDNDDFFPYVGFPVNLPHVVAVGGTTVRSNGVGAASSAMGDWITSGGGFSTITPGGTTPDYQTKAFTLTQNATWINGGAGLPGRGVPDMSALGALIATVAYDGFVYVSGGTSASAPIVAALITLINNERLNFHTQKTARNSNSNSNSSNSSSSAAHQPNGNSLPVTAGLQMTTLQSIHAWLYQNDSNANISRNVGGNQNIFVDIVLGDSCVGKAQNSMVFPTFPYCYSTRPGWDAVTGWGSIRNFSLLLESALEWNPPPPPPPPPPLPLPIVGIIVGCLGILGFVVALTLFVHCYSKKGGRSCGGSNDENGAWLNDINRANTRSSSWSSSMHSASQYRAYQPADEKQNQSNDDFYSGSV